MALCLAESLIEKRGFDPIDQLERYTQWAKHGRLSSNGRVFDIGYTVKDALMKFAKTREPYCGSPDPLSAGNGSLMRLAPVPLFYSARPAEAIERSAPASARPRAQGGWNDRDRTCVPVAGTIMTNFGALAPDAPTTTLGPATGDINAIGEVDLNAGTVFRYFGKVCFADPDSH